jgi:uracil-DNA glycosylase
LDNSPSYLAPEEQGPHTLLLIGEAPNDEDTKASRPFTGSTGKLLEELLALARFDLKQFHIVNVLSQPIPGGDIKNITVTKTELKRLGLQSTLPQLSKRYLHPQLEPELHNFREKVRAVKPDFTIALGGTAQWALTGDARITQGRGVLFDPDHGGRAISTYHPAAIGRQWDLRPLAWADLIKARRELLGVLEAPLDRKLYINPTEEELEFCYEQFAANPTDLLGVDIETAPGCDQITTIAFATPSLGVCIPLWDRYGVPALCNVHATASGEAARWRWVQRFAKLKNPKVLQNGLYDMQYLLDTLDTRLDNVLHDTAILQHSLQPELPKALGTLASLYLNEPLWKNMREGAKDEVKADE